MNQYRDEATVNYSSGKNTNVEQYEIILMNGHLANARAITRQLVCDNFRPDGASDVISCAGVDPTGVKADVKFDDSRSKYSPDIRLPHFVRTTTTTTMTTTTTTPVYVGHHIRA